MMGATDEWAVGTMRIPAGGWHVVTVCVAVAVGLGLAGASAQTGPAPPGAVGMDNRPTKSSADPIVAEVENETIHLSVIGDEIRGMPSGGAGNPLQALFPLALRQVIEREAAVIQARANGITDDPEVERHMQEASDRVLEGAYLHHEALKIATEQVLSDRYDAKLRGKPGPEEVQAKVILVPTEAAAQDIIAKLSGGADFAALARQSSKDASAREGGDLRFLPRDALAPEVGAVLFALRPGELAPYPVRTAGGWFVLQTVARRLGPTPSFSEARDRLIAEIERENAIPTLRQAVSRLNVRIYGIGGP
jgi:peptidyl-prolyl cis-trans isomerase C